MFRQQLRAILRASAYGKVRMLMPMVAHLGEVRLTLRGAGAGAAAARRRRPRRTSEVEVGAMIEVPAAALMIDRFLQHFDFVSHRHQRPDPVHAGHRPRRRGGGAPLRPLASGRAAADRTTRSPRANAMGTAVSVCGEMAGDAAFTELLLAMGLRSFSMHPARIASIKQRVLRADTRRLAARAGGGACERRPGSAMRRRHLQRRRRSCGVCRTGAWTAVMRLLRSRCRAIVAGFAATQGLLRRRGGRACGVRQEAETRPECLTVVIENMSESRSSLITGRRAGSKSCSEFFNNIQPISVGV